MDQSAYLGTGRSRSLVGGADDFGRLVGAAGRDVRRGIRSVACACSGTGDDVAPRTRNPRTTRPARTQEPSRGALDAGFLLCADSFARRGRVANLPADASTRGID